MTAALGTAPAANAVGLLRTVRAERIKLLTLRSYPVAISAALALLIATGFLRSFAPVWGAGNAAAVDAVTPSELLDGVQYVQLLLAIVAVMFITSEYSSGTVERSLLAVPSRTPVLLAKGIVLAVAAFAVGAIGSAAVLVVVPAALAPADVVLALPLDLAVQMIPRVGLYLVGITVLALGLATVIRSTVGALATVLALLTVAPLALSVIPVDWIARGASYLPTTAGLLILQPENPDAALTPWQGLVVLAAWALVATIAALIALRRRDA